MNSFPSLSSPIEVEKKRKAKGLPIEGYMPVSSMVKQKKCITLTFVEIKNSTNKIIKKI